MRCLVSLTSWSQLNGARQFHHWLQRKTGDGLRILNIHHNSHRLTRFLAISGTHTKYTVSHTGMLSNIINYVGYPVVSVLLNTKDKPDTESYNMSLWQEQRYTKSTWSLHNTPWDSQSHGSWMTNWQTDKPDASEKPQTFGHFTFWIRLLLSFSLNAKVRT